MSTDEHELLYQRLKAEDSDDDRSIPIRRKQLLGTLAHSILDEEKLQADVDANGITYVTTGDKGQHIEKKRPAYEELGRVRDRKLRYIKELGLQLSPMFADEFD
jgi:hypothetical protein